MIYRRIISVTCGLLVVIATVYILQGASFRLVESYAKFRLQLCWGDYMESKLNPVLSKLPLDHFAEPLLENHKLSKKAAFEYEINYSKKILSYLKPVKDRAFNYLAREQNSLQAYEIRDLGLVKSVILPGLFRPATMHDVSYGSARRIGDRIEFADCLFVHLTRPIPHAQFEKKFTSIESSFGFLADHGFASLLLPVSSSEALIAQLEYLQANFRNFAEHIIIYGENDLVPWVLDASEARPNLFKASVLRNPKVQNSPQANGGASWLLSIYEYGQGTPSTLLDWTVSARQAEFLYPSRLAGLIYQQNDPVTDDLSSLVLAYLLQCRDYLQEAAHHWTHRESKGDTEEENTSPTLSSKSSNQNNFLPVHFQDSSQSDQKYLCEVVKEYRAKHSSNPSVREASNRALILKIGSSIESMGPLAFDQLSMKDPEFIILYQALKKEDETPIQ
jgi:hypothetical protein